MRYEFAEEGLHFSVTCPGAVVSSVWKKPLLGPAIEKAKVPEDAIPAEDAAQIVLEGVAEKKGIIIVPENPGRYFWREYCKSSEAAENYLLNLAHERRIEYSKNKEYNSKK